MAWALLIRVQPSLEYTLSTGFVTAVLVLCACVVRNGELKKVILYPLSDICSRGLFFFILKVQVRFESEELGSFRCELCPVQRLG